MVDLQSLEVTCAECGMELVLEYTVVGARPTDVPPLGCPECQSTGAVLAAVEDLQARTAPRFLEFLALEKKTEVGVSAETAPHVGSPDEPIRPTHVRHEGS